MAYVFTKLADNWDALTEAEKVALFESTDYEVPTMADLATLGKFKVLTLSDLPDQQTMQVKAVPKPQLVLPKGLIPLDSFAGIKQSRATATVSVAVPDAANLLNMRFTSLGAQDYSGNTWVNSGVTFTEESPSGGKAAYFDGASQFQTANGCDLGTGDFTIYLRYKCGSDLFNAPYPALLSGISNDANRSILTFNPTSTRVRINGTLVTFANSRMPTDDCWHSFAITRQDGMLHLFLDGVLLDSQANTDQMDFSHGGATRIGNGSASDNHFCGYLDDICLIKGKALWTTEFKPPDGYLLPGTACCKLLATTDLETYYTYDAVKQEWLLVDHSNAHEIVAAGIDAADLANIPTAAWDALVSGAQGIGFAYLLNIEQTADVCEVDDLQMTVDMKGSWDMALPGTDYTYGYPLNTVLRVTLKTDGDYKINYEGVSGNFGDVGDVALAYVVKPDFVKANGALVSREDYPLLYSFAKAKNLIVTEAEWAGGMQGLYSEGDGSTTFRLPDLRGQFLRGLDMGAGVDEGRALGSAQGDAIRNITGKLGVRTANSKTQDDYGAFYYSHEYAPGAGGQGNVVAYLDGFDASLVSVIL